jgi:hypothetical protein
MVAPPKLPPLTEISDRILNEAVELQTLNDKAD